MSIYLEQCHMKVIALDYLQLLLYLILWYIMYIGASL